MPARRKSVVSDQDASRQQQQQVNGEVPAKASRREDKHEASPPPNVAKVVLDNHILEPIYGSFYPEDFLWEDITPPKASQSNGNDAARETKLPCLYVCHNCFKYTPDAAKYYAHRTYCDAAWVLPGRLIYTHHRTAGDPGTTSKRGGQRGRGRPGRPSSRGTSRYSSQTARMKAIENAYTLHEIDGEDATLFCQNLSLFAKLFLDQKGVCFFPQPFLYYVLVGPSQPSHTPHTPHGPQSAGHREILGFFSKEKLSWDSNILACILVFPHLQRLGLGRLLMALSYELARKQGRHGGPEGPLSTAGAAAYHRYWDLAVTRALLDEIDAAETRGGKRSSRADLGMAIDVKTLSEATHILPGCVATTLCNMGLPARRMRRKAGRGVVDADADSRAAITLNDLELVDDDGLANGADPDGDDMDLEQYGDVILLDREHIRDRARKIGLLDDADTVRGLPKRMPQLWEVDQAGWIKEE